jgi:putative restriction endonuclease
VRGFVAPTDHGWYQFLRARPEIDEVNFWRPGGGTFSALTPGEIFFFKLKAPYDAIGGLSGARTPMSMDRLIGCIAITQPVFFAPDEWIPVPRDWSRNIVSGRGYDLTEGEGLQLWTECLERAAQTHHLTEWTTEAIEMRRYGKPQLITPRLGQASFRLAVMDAYDGACAITNEHSLPVLEAAHIRPWKDGGRHELSNGLPLRRDIHRLFDLGFVTIKPDLRFAVSPALRDAYANGKTYYALDGGQIAAPVQADAQPSQELLEWHGDVVFRA